VVTGISTGAIQGLFVANQDWSGLARAYTIAAQSDLAIAKGELGLLTMGAQFDTEPLRRKIVAYLTTDAFARLKGLGQGPGPHLLIGMVRARDGALLVVDIRQAVANFYAADAAPDAAAQARLADCVTGVVMASAAVPAQLRPVRLALAGAGPATHVDGGVRSSVFAALVGETAQALAADKDQRVDVEIDVIRNGPTVVFAETDPAGRPPPVDRKPSVLAVGKRAYTTIVNQVEVASIALLRLLFPHGTIRVITADGFNNPADNPEPRPRPPEDHVFDPEFMRALIAWGRRRAGREGGPEWIALAAIGADAATPPRKG
jgi:predicted acylesterase/phospholipase RssA